jgi:hypothetical protein
MNDANAISIAMNYKYMSPNTCVEGDKILDAALANAEASMEIFEE